MFRNRWYIACASSQLRAAPRASRILDHDLVLFRDDVSGCPGALLDPVLPSRRAIVARQHRRRGPHVPLPLRLALRPHCGRCIHIPSLRSDARTSRGRAGRILSLSRAGGICLGLAWRAGAGNRASPANPRLRGRTAVAAGVGGDAVRRPYGYRKQSRLVPSLFRPSVATRPVLCHPLSRFSRAAMRSGSPRLASSCSHPPHPTSSSQYRPTLMFRCASTCPTVYSTSSAGDETSYRDGFRSDLG